MIMGSDGTEDMIRFIDYFFMCGLCESELPKLYKHYEETSLSGLKEKKLISSVLCHFPKNVADNPWNSAELWKLCTPGGLSVHMGENSPTKDPHFHSFLITREDGSKTYGHVLTFYELCVNPKQKKDITYALQMECIDVGKHVFVEKCIGLITQFAFINTCKKVLQNLYKLFMKTTPGSSNGQPIESYIYNLLYEVPLLSPGTSLKLSCMGHDDPVIVHLPGASDLPLLDVHLSKVFRMLGGAKNLLNLLTSLLFEHQILIVSEDSYKLAVVAECVTSLLFPFQWQHTHVSVLPYELATHFFDAPVPYLIGVLVIQGEKQLIRQALEVNQCYVDLDDSIVEYPEDQTCFPGHKDIINQLELFMQKYIEEMGTSSIQEKSDLTTNHISDAFPTHDKSSSNITEKVSTHTSGLDLSTNETISRVTDIARKAGVYDSTGEDDSLHANIASTKLNSKMQSLKDVLRSKTNEMKKRARMLADRMVKQSVVHEQKFNIRVRETIAASFLSIFFQYDKFVIHPSLDESGMWTFSTDTQDNFDKTSFLSDQPESRLPFLYSFVDTQMFASFIDCSIIAHQSQQDGESTKDPYLRLFDERIELSKIPLDPRTPTTVDPSSPLSVFRTLSVSSSHNLVSPYLETWMNDAEIAVEKRLDHVDMVSCLPHPVHLSLDEDLSGMNIMSAPGTFPVIRNVLLESEGFESKKRHLRRRDQSRTSFKKQSSFRDSKWRKIQEARAKLLRQPSMSEYSPELIAQTNWMFVEKLLKDVKHKTKKILVGKMGKEAIELGHRELSDSVSNLEENTWIASLCDLLERVWSHGLLTNYKKGKSALWSHLLQYQVEHEDMNRKKLMYHHFSGSSPSLVSEVVDNESSRMFDPSTSYYSLPRSFPRKRANDQQKYQSSGQKQNESSLNQSIPPLDYTILTSMGRIQSMREIQTEVGRSRAWIRLALEQKQLHSYLREILSNHHLLDQMYKKYSLLQCDEQREQFLYHLLTLNATDFSCFTNSFSKTIIEYKVWIIPGRQFAGLSQTSANVYMWICGELCKTEQITIPKGCLEFSFKHSNLGIMTSLVIGHDNAGILSKWLLDDVIVQNQVTGQTCLFPCRRWLGRGIDDNSLERLLVAEIIPIDEDILKYISVRAHRGGGDSSDLTIPELQEKVGQAVNNIVKYCHRPPSEHRLEMLPPPASFTKLINNLICALQSVFTHGLKAGRIFKRRLFALDVITASFEHFRDNVSPAVPTIRGNISSPSHTTNVTAGDGWFLGSRRSSAFATGEARKVQSNFDNRRDVNDIVKSDSCLAKERTAFARMCQLYQQVSSTTAPIQKLGKDDIFKLLMCVGLHEHSLSLWLPRISDVARNSHQLYDDSAFLCDASAVLFLSQVLNMLNYDVPIDTSLLRGHDHIMMS